MCKTGCNGEKGRCVCIGWVCLDHQLLSTLSFIFFYVCIVHFTHVFIYPLGLFIFSLKVSTGDIFPAKLKDIKTRHFILPVKWLLSWCLDQSSSILSGPLPCPLRGPRRDRDVVAAPAGHCPEVILSLPGIFRC